MAKKIKVYSSPNCVYCRLAKEFFKKNKIDFKEVDVSEDDGELQQMIDKSGQMGVPVIEIDGDIIIGFNEPAIKKVLGIK